jgi:nicotinamide-nucleotide amidase
VVSVEVAKAMALGVKKLFNSDYAVATTGNAGPTKGDSDAEVGTVCIAIATPKHVFAKQFTFGKDRERITTKAVHMAFTLLQKEIF